MAPDDDGRLTPAEQETIEHAIDAVDRLGTVVDGFTGYVYAVEDVKQHSMRYRLNLLWVHAVAALLMAPLLIATGHDGISGPSFAFFRHIPGSPYSAATVLGVGGFILGWGCIWRHKRIEIIGLASLAAFYLFLAISFAIPPAQWLAHHDGHPKPPMYAPIVYLHLSVIMLMHIAGLINVLRDELAMAQLRTRTEPAP